MKKTRLTEAQIITMLNENESGLSVSDLLRKYNIASSTFYTLKSKYSGISISELKRLKELESENKRLKHMYADLSLEHKILSEVMEKKYPGLIDEN